MGAVFDPKILEGVQFLNLRHLFEKRDHGVHFTNKSDRWSTPDGFYTKLNDEFGFTLDACASHDNAKCKKYFDEKANGLEQDWQKATVFMNPPYSNAAAWMAKAREEARKGATVVCLVPARVDTKWWHDSVMGQDDKGCAQEVRLVRGRLKFSGAKDGAPFPSAVVVYRPGLKGPLKFDKMER